MKLLAGNSNSLSPFPYLTLSPKIPQPSELASFVTVQLKEGHDTIFPGTGSPRCPMLDSLLHWAALTFNLHWQEQEYRKSSAFNSLTVRNILSAATGGQDEQIEFLRKQEMRKTTHKKLLNINKKSKTETISVLASLFHFPNYNPIRYAISCKLLVR